MWRYLRKFYNYETRQYTFPRADYLAHKNIILKDMNTGKYERRYESETSSYIIFKTVAVQE